MKKGVFIIIGIILLNACSLFARTRSLPIEDFDSEIPLHPGSSVVSIIELNMPYGIQATLEIEAPLDEVLAYYKGLMEKRGWVVYVERENFLAFFKHGSGLIIDTERMAKSRVKATLVMADAYGD